MEDKNVLSSTDRGCSLCQNTRPCHQMDAQLLEPVCDSIWGDEQQNECRSSWCDAGKSDTCRGMKACSSHAKSQANKQEKRFRCYQDENWMQKYDQLTAFRKKFGHCCVPCRFKANPSLGLWVKRQRNQYVVYKAQQKADCGNRRHRRSSKLAASALTPHRIDLLEQLDFVWNFRDALWLLRYEELKQYFVDHGHTNVPANWQPNEKLSSWVKSQKHQIQRQLQGRSSTMTEDRQQKLEALGF